MRLWEVVSFNLVVMCGVLLSFNVCVCLLSLMVLC